MNCTVAVVMLIRLTDRPPRVLVSHDVRCRLTMGSAWCYSVLSVRKASNDKCDDLKNCSVCSTNFLTNSLPNAHLKILVAHFCARLGGQDIFKLKFKKKDCKIHKVSQFSRVSWHWPTRAFFLESVR